MYRYITLAIAITMMMFAVLLTADDENPGEQAEPVFGPHHGGFMAGLNLTDSQQEEIEDIQVAHRRSTIDIHADIQKLEMDLEGALNDGDFNQAKKLSRQISNKKADLQEGRLDMQKQIHSKLNEEQKAQYLKMISHRGPRGERGEMRMGRGMSHPQGQCEEHMNSGAQQGSGKHKNRF